MRPDGCAASCTAMRCRSISARGATGTPYFVGRYYDAPNQLIVKALVRPGDTVVDIGGNEGMIALVAAHVVGPGGR